MSLKLKLNLFRTLGQDEIFLFILLFLIINPISYSRINPFILVVLSVIWLLAANIVSRHSMSKSLTNKMFVVTCIYPIFLLLYSVRADVLFEKKSAMDCIIILFFLYSINRRNTRSIEKQMKCIMLYLTLISVYTIYQLTLNPLVSRLMAGSAAIYGNFLTGGYNTVYGVMLLSLALIGVITKTKVKSKYLPVLVIFVVFILLSQYTTAFLLLTIGTVMIIFNKKRAWRIIFLIFVSACITFVVIFPEIVSGYISYLAHLFPSGTFQRYRIQQLAELIVNFSNGNYGSTTTEGTIIRVDLYREIGKTIGDNFFFGVGNADRTLVGNHATFLDVIAKYGIFCGGTYVFARLYLIKKISTMIPDTYQGYYKIIGVIYIVLSLLNTTDDMMISTMIFVTIPYIFLLNSTDQSYSKIQVIERNEMA